MPWVFCPLWQTRNVENKSQCSFIQSSPKPRCMQCICVCVCMHAPISVCIWMQVLWCNEEFSKFARIAFPMILLQTSVFFLFFVVVVFLSVQKPMGQHNFCLHLEVGGLWQWWLVLWPMSNNGRRRGTEHSYLFLSQMEIKSIAPSWLKLILYTVHNRPTCQQISGDKRFLSSVSLL